MTMKPKALFVPVLLALSFAIPACGSESGGDASTQSESTAPPSSGAAAPSGEARRSEKVEIVEYSYDPDPVTVQVGGKVIWQNDDTVAHTATADDGSFDTGVIEPGKLKSETFKRAGTYAYFCEIHPTMHGTVEVVEKG